MGQITVGVRKLGARLSRYLKQAEAGTVIVVTIRGRPVAQILPVTLPLDAQLKALADTVASQGGEEKPADTVSPPQE